MGIVLERDENKMFLYLSDRWEKQDHRLQCS